MSSTLLTPTTELEAINGILASIGETPINTLVGSLPLEAARARRKLQEQLRVIQTRSWSFNTDTSVALSPGPDGSITLPANVIDVQRLLPPTLSTRGNRIYNPAERTFTITEAVTADLILVLPFEDLPEPAKYYVYITAGHTAQNETLGDDSRERFTLDRIKSAWVTLMNWESRRRDYTLTTNQSVRRLFRRRGV